MGQGLAVEHERGTGKPLVSLARHGEAWSGRFDGDGGFARWGITGVRCSKGSRGYGPSKLAQKRQEGWGVAHRARNWMGKRRRFVDGEVPRRRSELLAWSGG